MRLVFIEWVDSFGCSSSWQSLEGSIPSLLKCRSVGWLLHDTEECKVIVPHISDQNHSQTSQQGCGDMTIPTRAIVKMVDIVIPDTSKEQTVTIY